MFVVSRQITKEEFLKAIEESSSIKDLCKHLNRSKPSVYTYASRFKIPLKKRYITKDYIRTDGYFYYNNPKNHRRIVETLLGRKLLRNECVHHIDGDKSNNDISNLLVCELSFHQELHSRMSKLYQKENFNSNMSYEDKLNLIEEIMKA